MKGLPWVIRYHACKSRCNNKNNLRYKDYGGRGIKLLLTIEDIKKAWIRDKASKMKRPSIDRIDNDGHYEPKNIRFIERSENTQKRRNIKLSYKHIPEIIELYKKGHSFASIARKYGLFYTTISKVVRNKLWPTNRSKQAIKVKPVCRYCGQNRFNGFQGLKIHVGIKHEKLSTIRTHKGESR